ncbi:protein kinase [Myxococcota bacterium]|nr:protein kinase [Myxococcota bacterium]
MSTTIGKVLHQTYRLDKALSEGGMGQVFVASHLRVHNRQYAVKRLRPELAASERFLARFRIEAQAMMALEHPNIVRIEDFLVDEHTYYLVMEYIRGRPLDEIIFFQKRLSPAQVASIAIQMLDALECCHAQHIIHRDLKPSNVLVEESGRIKLTDFGIALQEDLTSRLTNTGTLLGTPDYMSPEQITSKEMDGRSDLYSLGIMLYEMLTGRLPFLRTQESEGSYVILFAHVHTEPPPIQDATLPAFLVEATLRCLKKHPDQRFLDAAQMRQFLLQHLPSEAWLHTRETKEEVSSLAKGIPNLYDTQGKPASPASAALLKAAPSSPFQPITPPQQSQPSLRPADRPPQTSPSSADPLPSTAAFDRENKRHTQRPSVQYNAPTALSSSLPTGQPLAKHFSSFASPPSPPQNKRRFVSSLFRFLLLLAILGGGWWYYLDGPDNSIFPFFQTTPLLSTFSDRPSEPVGRPSPTRITEPTLRRLAAPEPHPRQRVEIPQRRDVPQPRQRIEVPQPQQRIDVPQPQQRIDVPPRREEPQPRQRIEIPQPRERVEIPQRREEPQPRQRIEIPQPRERVEIPQRREEPQPRQRVEVPKPRERIEIPQRREEPRSRQRIEIPRPRQRIEIPQPQQRIEVPQRREEPQPRQRVEIPQRREEPKPPIDPLEARKRALLRSITWPQRVPELCQEFLDTCLLSCFDRRKRNAPRESVKRRLVLCKKECWRLRKAHPEVREMCGLSE